MANCRSLPVLIRRLCILSLFLGFFQLANAAVLGIDIGADSFKVSLVKPGVPMQIVTNEASKRKTAALIGFHNGERVFGDAAAQLRARYPDRIYSHLFYLLGQTKDSPFVNELKSSIYYPYKIETDGSRGSLSFVIDDKTQYTVEELMAMLLSYIRDLSQAVAKTSIKDVVITVPPWFTQYERQALLDAASIAGLKVLALMNVGTAVGLHYGIDRDFPNATNVLFYDLGASSVKITVATFTSKTEKEAGKNKTVGSMEIRGTSWDSTVGGNSFDNVLAEHLADEFEKAHKGKDVKNNARAMSKLRGEAERVKRILSANSETSVTVEGLIDDIDFRSQLKREKLEALCMKYFQQAIAPIKAALQDAGLTVDKIDAVEVFGAATRVPKIQSMLAEFFKKDEITAHLNTDEAAALGAGFHAASLSTAFRVRKFNMADNSPFPVGVKVLKDDAEKKGKTTTLFQHNNKLLSRKAMSWSRKEDFSLEMAYEPHATLPRAPGPLAKVTIGGVADAMIKYPNATKGLPIKVNVQFTLTRSGTVAVEKADSSLVEEVTVIVTPSPTPVNGSSTNATASSSTADNSTTTTTTTAEPSPSAEPSSSEDGSGSTEGGDAAVEQQASDEDAEEASKTTTTTTPAASTTTAAAAAATSSDGKAPQTKTYKKYHKVTLKVTWETLGLPQPLTDEAIKASSKRLGDLAERDRLKREREDARNAIESYIYEIKEKLSSVAEVELVTKAEQVEAILKSFEMEEDWLYEDGASPDLTAKNFTSRLDKLRKEPDAIFARVFELKERPEAVKEALKMFNGSRAAVEALAVELPHILNETKQEFLATVTEAETWLKNKTEEQEKTPAYEKPVVTASEIRSKIENLLYKLKVLKNIPKPKPKIIPSFNGTNVNGTNTNSTAQEESFSASGESATSESPSKENTGKSKDGGDEKDKASSTKKQGKGDEAKKNGDKGSKSKGSKDVKDEL